MDINNQHPIIGRAGFKLSYLVPGTESWKPYFRADVINDFSNSKNVKIEGVSFKTGKNGGKFNTVIGASGMLSPDLSLYGELSS
ncbi:TPA: autotransporter outer membrane beta-barrel domain-containing protein, partial [Salmonella enterica]